MSNKPGGRNGKAHGNFTNPGNESGYSSSKQSKYTERLRKIDPMAGRGRGMMAKLSRLLGLSKRTNQKTQEK